MVWQIIILYFSIAILYWAINASRCIKIVRINKKYQKSFPFYRLTNKDFEKTVIQLAAKADINYSNYINDKEILKTISDPTYKSNYEELFIDIASRYRQNMKRFLHWPILAANLLTLHLFGKNVLQSNIFIKAIIWVFSILAEYYLIKFIENTYCFENSFKIIQPK